MSLFDTMLAEVGINVVLTGIQMHRMNAITERWVQTCRLRLPLPDVVAMQTRQPSLEGTGEGRLRRLVKEALRMRPSRIMGYRYVRNPDAPGP